MSRNLVRDDLYVRVYGDHEQRLRRVQQRVPGEWIYVGTYPGDVNTTPDSPAYLNAYSRNVSDPLRFRWLLDGRPEFRGKFVLGTLDAAVFLLPSKARPDNSYSIPYCGVVDDVPGALIVQSNGNVVWSE